jgi:hypothetical protein
MKSLIVLFAAIVLAVAGCNETKPSGGSAGPTEEKNRANLEKLSPEDQALAEQQKVCPVSDEPLGSMGTPIKLMVKDQPVFICCKSCEKSALKDPDATLAKVKELKEKNRKKE